MKPLVLATDEERRNGILTSEHQLAAVRHFSHAGCLWLEHVFERSLVEQISRAFFERYCGLDPDELRRSSLEVGERRFMISVSFEAPFDSEALYANPLILSILEALLGSSFVLQSLGSVLALPGSGDQHVHADHPRLFESEELSASLPPYAITCVVPLVDLTPETGTTSVWQGSHRRPPSETEDANDDAATPFPRMGDVYLMDYRLKHAGTANRSQKPRPLLYLVYSRSWFIDSANFASQPRIIISSDAFERIPTRHRRLFAQAPRPHDPLGHPA